MELWKLAVIDTESPDWRASTYKGDAIVRADSEHMARLEAAKAFAIATERIIGQNTTINPWGQKEIVSCEPFESSEYVANGEACGLGSWGQVLHCRIRIGGIG